MKKYYMAIDKNNKKVIRGTGKSKELALENAVKNIKNSKDIPDYIKFEAIQCSEEVFISIKENKFNNSNFPYRIENGIAIIDKAEDTYHSLYDRIKISKEKISELVCSQESFLSEIIRNQIVIMEEIESIKEKLRNLVKEKINENS